MFLSPPSSRICLVTSKAAGNGATGPPGVLAMGGRPLVLAYGVWSCVGKLFCLLRFLCLGSVFPLIARTVKYRSVGSKSSSCWDTLMFSLWMASQNAIKRSCSYSWFHFDWARTSRRAFIVSSISSSVCAPQKIIWRYSVFIKSTVILNKDRSLKYYGCCCTYSSDTFFSNLILL